MKLLVDEQHAAHIRRFSDAVSFPRHHVRPGIRQPAGTLAVNPNAVARVIEGRKRDGCVQARRVGGISVAPHPPGQEERQTMDEQRTSYPYRQFTITTLRHEGVWWAKARVAEKDVGGDRPVLGGPWKSQSAAKVAAQAFCDRGKAG